MISREDVLFEHRKLFYSLIAIGFIFLVANLLDLEKYPLTETWYPTDLLYITIPAIAIVFGSILSARYRIKGNHGKAWIFLTLAVTCWYIAENTYVYDNEYENANLATYTSEIFFLIGYPLFFAFGVFYLKARKKIISKKGILFTTVISLALVIPSLYITFDLEEEELGAVDVIITALYPVLDGIILAPAMIGVMLFFRGQVNLLWTLMMFGLVCHVVGDTFYLGSYIDDSYYPGHFSDMIFLWGYTLFTFGFYSHLKLYRKESPHSLDTLEKH